MNYGLILVDGSIWVTELSSNRVIDFRFYDFDLGFDPAQPEDFSYHLIRISDSSIITDLASHTLTRPAMPVLGPEDLNHFRIGFDDHGAYDIICVDVNMNARKVATST